MPGFRMPGFRRPGFGRRCFGRCEALKDRFRKARLPCGFFQKKFKSFGVFSVTIVMEASRPGPDSESLAYRKSQTSVRRLQAPRVFGRPSRLL
jgi:hypothetical protein